MDNGSAFLADVTQAFLHQHRVLPLFSPPYTPRYNGAIEAGIGSLKTRTETHASRQGHPGSWSADDVAAAHLEANAIARPHGPGGPTPDTLWGKRAPILHSERTVFLETVERHRQQARHERGLDTSSIATDTSAGRSLDRIAIRRALVEHGYLLFRRRRVPLPITHQEVTKHS